MRLRQSRTQRPLRLRQAAVHPLPRPLRRPLCSRREPAPETSWPSLRVGQQVSCVRVCVCVCVCVCE